MGRRGYRPASFMSICCQFGQAQVYDCQAQFVPTIRVVDDPKMVHPPPFRWLMNNISAEARLRNNAPEISGSM
jgi:hypothetical protein